MMLSTWNVMNINNIPNYQATKNNNWRENVAKLSDEKWNLAENLYYFE